MDETNNEYHSITLKIFEIVENFGLWILEKIHLNFLADIYRKKKRRREPWNQIRKIILRQNLFPV